MRKKFKRGSQKDTGQKPGDRKTEKRNRIGPGTVGFCRLMCIKFDYL